MLFIIEKKVNIVKAAKNIWRQILPIFFFFVTILFYSFQSSSKVQNYHMD